MCYVFYAFALIFCLGLPAYIGAISIGLSIGILWDAISFIITIGGSFFLVATASGTATFYKDNKFLEMWGDLALKMGFIGSFIGWIYMLGGMAQPPEPGVDAAAKLGAGLAVSLITMLYGLLFKYVLILPWLECRKK